MAFVRLHLTVNIMKKIKNNSGIGVIYVLLAAIFWGTIGLYVRQLRAAGLTSWDIALTRMGVGLIAMAGYLLLFQREKLAVHWRDLWLFAGAGILSLLCMNYCYTETVQITSLAIAGTLLYTAPTFVMLFSLLFFREIMTKRKLLALLLAFCGCALVSGIARGQLSLTPKALLLGLGSGLSYALYSIFSRAALERGYDSWTTTFYSFAFCTIACLLFARPGHIVACTVDDPALLFSMALLGLLTGFAAYLLYTRGLCCLEAGQASIIASLELVAGALVGGIAYREHIGFDGIIGILLLLCAIVVLRVPGKK